MPLSINSTILERFTVTHEDLEDEILLYRAKENDQEVQILSLSPKVRIRQYALEHFNETHQNQYPAPIWYGKTQQNILAIYAEVVSPLPKDLRISIEDSEKLLHHLLSQLQKNPNAFPRGLRRSDVGISKENTVILRATGAIHPHNHVRPDIFQTKGTSLQQGLYGIAILIFSLIGTLPKISKKRDWEMFQDSPPELRTYIPDAPEELNTLLAIMMHPNPTKREEALSYLREVPPFALDVTHKEPPKKTRTVQVTRPRRAQTQETILPQWLIFCSDSQIPINTARKIAAITGIDPMTLSRPNNTAPIAGAATQAEAQKIMELISSFGINTHIQNKNAGLKGLSFFGMSILLGMGSFFISAILALALIFLGVFGGLGLGFMRSTRVQEKQVQWNILHTGKNIPDTVYQGRAATQDVRKTIMSSPLPEIAKIELHAAIDELDDILDGHQETQKELSNDLLAEIVSACSHLSESIQQDQEAEYNISSNIRKKSQLVQKLANQMRSL